jgi:hypothetical protein
MNNWEILAPMVILVVLTLTIGGVLILRPIAKHLGGYLEAMTRRQLEPGNEREMALMRETVETMSQRLTLLEERQDFSERLLESQERKVQR